MTTVTARPVGDGSRATAAPARAPADATGRGTRRFAAVVAVLLVLIVAGVLVGMLAGTHGMSPAQVVDAVALRWTSAAWAESPAALIVWNLRLPRALLAVLVGANLAAAGVMLQGVMRNPLAAPDVIGVTAGAALAATVMIVAAPAVAASGTLAGLALPAAAFAGAAAAAAVVFVLSWQPGVGTSAVRMILAGVAVAAMIGGLQGFLMVYFSDRVQGVVLWLAGSLNTRSWRHVALVAPFTLLGLALAAALVRPLNLLQLGDTVAHGLGVPVHLTRVVAIASAALLTGSAVCAVGVLGFVGLVVPHITRLTVGHGHARLLPAAALAGAALVLWADIGARLLGEVPVGVLTALVGGPYFVALLYGRKLL